MTARLGLLACALVLLMATDAAAQQVKAHMEACTEWRHASGALGTRNSCDRPISILFMALADQHVVEREVAPGAWFDSGAASDLSSGWMFTACPAGYVPNIRFAAEDKTAILDSLYNCLSTRPGV
jgi:hypothetical protein